MAFLSHFCVTSASSLEREADGAKIMAWYHRQFIEMVNARYHPNNRDNTYRYIFANQESVASKADEAFMQQILYEYFSGKWGGGKLKPFTYTKKQQKKYKLDNKESEADRFVSNQPSIFCEKNSLPDIENLRYNRRKLGTAEKGHHTGGRKTVFLQ